MGSESGSFEFYADYEKTVYELQPEMYREVQRITESELREIAKSFGRLPRVLDVGAAGLIPYDVTLAESVTILDLFPKPPSMKLKDRVLWEAGNILEHRSVDDERYEVVVMSSVLHHLADKHNNARANVALAFKNVAKRLKPGGALFIFESTCHGALSVLQDLLYPVTSRVLVSVMNFTRVRMLSRLEVMGALDGSGLVHTEVQFRQPPYIAQVRWRVPSKYYPLSISCFKGVKPGNPRGSG
jgi:hypothetical protein